MRASSGKIALRADGSNATGLGHIYRVLALASVFSENNECVIVTRPGNGVETIGEKFPVVVIPHLDARGEAAWLSERYSPAEWMLVADGYHFDGTYQKVITSAGYYLIYIDDLISGHYYADLVVNHSLAARASQYDAEPATRFALGADYALLRSAFLSKASPAKRRGERSKALVCFGGADPADLLLKACTALTRFTQVKEINAVVGSAYSAKQMEALKLVSGLVRIHHHLGENELAGLMAGCDFAVSSASNVLYELCAVHIPVLAGYYVPNQEGLYKGFLESGAINGAGNVALFDVRDFESAIRLFMAEESWEKYVAAQEKIFDGKTRQRLSQLSHVITYRVAAPEDVMLVYGWANDAQTRSNSYSTEPIDLVTHKNWFSRKIADPGTQIYIAELDGQPAGMVRYEIKDNHTVVGILLGASFRGRSLSPVLLKDTVRLYFRTQSFPVHAYIKKSNQPSIRAFEKAGYKLSEEKVVQGAASYIYRIEQNDV